MIALDEDALICDFAETYHIYDYQELPVTYAATLAVGLRENSRIKMRMTDRNAPIETIILAGIIDRLSVLLAGEQARLISKNFVNVEQEQPYGFDSGEEFEAAWHTE